MAETPGQLLIALVSEAADAALASGTLAGHNIDRAAFIARNRAALLTVIASQQTLRAQLAHKYADQLASAQCRHPLLTGLLSADPATSTAAAERLGNDPTALAPSPAPPTQPQQLAPRSAHANGDDRRASHMRRRLEQVRAHRDQARGQLEYIQRELREVKAERDAALSDRDEALTNADALRAQLAAERTRSASLATDLRHAATVLASALRPAPAIEPERDIRELDRQDSAATAISGIAVDEDSVRTAAPAPPRDTDRFVAEILDQADLDVDGFLTVLDAIAKPPALAEPPVGVFALRREITVTPLGGGMEIGGSCLLVEVGKARILVDCGTRPKQRLSRIGPPDLDIALTDDIDAVIITHAHNDHAGYVPALVARYPFMKVLTSADTAALLPTMWNDSVKVFERTAHEHVEAGEPADTPPYRTPQVLAAIDRIRAVAFGRIIEIADGVTAELFPAGHILGAAGVVITAGTSRVTVTGDVSTTSQNQASVSGLVVPDVARGSDLLVIESTYCREGGSPRAREVERFVDTVRETVDGGGRVLVPAFALGRAQEVVLTLRNELSGVPVLVDGLAKEVSRIYEQQTVCRDNPLTIFGDDVREIAPGARREQYLAMRRGVIVTTSGMLTGGPAITWARWMLPDPKAALLISGYQDEESAGAALLALADNQAATFLLEGEPVEVRATVAKFALSAHADRAGLTSIVRDIGPRQVMLVHGFATAQRDFADHLRRHGHTMARTVRWTS
jgi:Cft2 family RNA processing exonuclease